MKSSDIISLLKQKHKNDVCVEQCKMHVSWNSGKIDVPNSSWKDLCYKRWQEAPRSTEQSQYWHDAWAKSWKAESPIIDLWVLPRKWKLGGPICYEVKISRNDLQSDHKFPDYWSSCNQYYFVLPHKLITQDEMNKYPPQVGFIEVTKNGKNLRIKKKPIYMKQEIDSRIYRYVLMWRTKIVSSRFREFN